VCVCVCMCECVLIVVAAIDYKKTFKKTQIKTCFPQNSIAFESFMSSTLENPTTDFANVLFIVYFRSFHQSKLGYKNYIVMILFKFCKSFVDYKKNWNKMIINYFNFLRLLCKALQVYVKILVESLAQKPWSVEFYLK